MFNRYPPFAKLASVIRYMLSAVAYELMYLLVLIVDELFSRPESMFLFLANCIMKAFIIASVPDPPTLQAAYHILNWYWQPKIKGFCGCINHVLCGLSTQSAGQTGKHRRRCIYHINYQSNCDCYSYIGFPASSLRTGNSSEF